MECKRITSGASPCSVSVVPISVFASSCGPLASDSLLLLPESKETDTRDLDDLEADTGNVTLGLSAATEAGNENLVVLVGEVEAAVVGDEGGDLLAVLDELHTDTLANSRVGLLGLNTDLGLVVARIGWWRECVLEER